MSENGSVERDWTADVGAQRVAQVYAEALLNAAEKHKRTEEVLEEFDSLIHDLFRAEPNVEQFLFSSAVSREHKAHVIQTVFAERASELFSNFLLVLNQHDRLSLLPAILRAVRELRDQRAHRMRVQVRSALALTGEQEERLRRELRETFHAEPLLETRVDPDLLGGMVVRVGDWLYDASVRTQLETIRNQLIARSSYEIQSGRDRFSTPIGN